MIEEHNFSPYILSAAGYGEYRPVAPNDSVKNRALNRRVDIIILKSTSEAKEPK
jgi:chemotaxis protein MotB